MGNAKLMKITKAIVPDKVIGCSFIIHTISVDIGGTYLVWEDGGSGSSTIADPFWLPEVMKGIFFPSKYSPSTQKSSLYSRVIFVGSVTIFFLP